MAKNWLLPEFGLPNQSKHSTQKRLKANTATIIKNEKAHAINYEAELNKGYQKGYEDAIAKATPEINKKLTQLSALISQLSTYQSKIDEKAKEDIYQFVLMVCEKIVMEKMQESEPISKIVGRAMEIIEGNSLGLKLYCHESLFVKLSSNSIVSANLTIEKDNSLSDFDFRLESEKQFLEFNLKDAIKEIVDNAKDVIIGNAVKP